MRKIKIEYLTLSATGTIYGDNPIVPKLESMLPEPKSPYAVTKLDGEYYCKMFNDERWLKTASLRYFNVFGPRQDPKSQYAAAIPIFIRKALQNKPIIIFGDGQQTRDFIYVKDIAGANVYLATHSEFDGVYNTAYGNSITINGLAKKIIEITGSKSPIKYKPQRAGDVKYSCADINNLIATGFKPTSDFVSGLEETVKFFTE